MTQTREQTMREGAQFAAALRLVIDVAATKTGLTQEALYVALVIVTEHYFPNDVERFIEGLRDCSSSREDKGATVQ